MAEASAALDMVPVSQDSVVGITSLVLMYCMVAAAQKSSIKSYHLMKRREDGSEERGSIV